MINDLDRLKLLEATLSNATLDSVESMGALANEIESIRSALDVVCEDFSSSFARLWAALEVVAEEHQENGTAATDKEIEDLETMKEDLISWTEREIATRASSREERDGTGSKTDHEAQ